MDDLIRNVLIVLVVLILLYFLLKWFTSKAKKLTTLEEGTVKQTITSEDLPANNTSNYTYSVWYFVADWNYKYGEEKSLLEAGASEDGEHDAVLSVKLGAQSNDLLITILCYKTAGGASETIQAAADLALQCPDDCADASDGTCNADGTSAGCHGSGAWGVYPLGGNAICRTFNADANGNVTDWKIGDTDYGDWPGFQLSPNDAQAGEWTQINPAGSNYTGALPPPGASKYMIDCSKCIDPESGPARPSGGDSIPFECNVRNFPLQKWVNLTVSVYGRTLDVYIDGKLVKTCVLTGPAVAGSGEGVVLTGNGGFDGFTSNLKYWADASNPQQAYNIYKDGYGGGAGANILSKYRLKVAYLEDGQERGSFEI